MEKEIVRNFDKFSNHETNRYSCPQCGGEWLTYVYQFDSHLCDVEGCGWSEGIFGDHEPQIDYDSPRRSPLTYAEMTEIRRSEGIADEDRVSATSFVIGVGP